MHANARLTRHGKELIVARHRGGMPLAHIADQLGISRQTASKWWRRYLEEGSEQWWLERSSRPGSCPHRIDNEIEDTILDLRDDRLGPAQIAYRVGVSSATVWRVLNDHGVNRLRFLDPPTGAVIRYERDHPGELVHVDTKRFGRIPDGGGRFALGDAGYRTAARIKQRVGYIHVHAAVDDHSRLAFAAVYEDATAPSCSRFLEKAIDYFATYGIRIETVMTDNAKAYLGKLFTATRTDWAINHITTRPYRPQTNGKVERFFSTLKTEWAYRHRYPTEQERITALDTWLHHYNTERHHTAINGPPITRVNNVPD